MGFTRRSTVKIDCRREPQRFCEQIRQAFEDIENRFGEMINEEGQLVGNLPQGVKIRTPGGGDIDMSEVMQSFTKENPEEWELIASVQSNSSTPPPDPIVDPEAIAMTHAGDIFIEVQDGPSNGTIKFHSAEDYVLTGTVLATLTDTSLDNPDPLVFVAPDDRWLIVRNNTNNTLVLIDASSRDKLEVAQVLDISSLSTSPWRDAKWSIERNLLWICDGSGADRVTAIRITPDLNMEIAATFSDGNLNRAKSINISDTEDALYVGCDGRIAVLNVADLTAISLVETETFPSGSTACFVLARQRNKMAAVTNETDPATVYGVEITSEFDITLKGKVQISQGDATQRNQGGVMSDSVLSFITRPEATNALIMLINMSDLDNPREVDFLDTGQGNVVSRYYTPVENRWILYKRPGAIDTFIDSYRGGYTSVEIPGDPDLVQHQIRAAAAVFESLVLDGLSPFIVNSRTLVPRLNVDLLDDLHAGEIIDLAVSRSQNEWLFWERINGP